MANYEKITISLHKDVIMKIEETMMLENRGRSNVVDTILRKYYNLDVRKVSKLKKDKVKLYAIPIKKQRSYIP